MANLPVLVSILWLTGMIAAVAHAARPLTGWKDAVVMAAAFAMVLALSQWLGPMNGLAGIAICVTAAWRLVRSGSSRVDFAFAGICAGFAASIYAANGVDLWLAVGISIAGLALSIGLARDTGFATHRVREGALLAAAWIAPIVAAAPDVMAGWKSAQALSQAGEASAMRDIPLWAIGFVAAALLGGALRGYWTRK